MVAADLAGAVDVDLVAERAGRCRSVARLSGGLYGEVASYLPGRRVRGVRTADGQVEVHVVACWDVPVADVAAEVREAVGPIAGGLPINVCIDDVELPEASSSPRETAQIQEKPQIQENNA